MITLLLLPLAAGAQSAVTATGGTVTDGTHTLTYSVGQVASGQTASATHTLHEGVVQPITVEEVGIPEPGLQPAVSLFPNPTAMAVTLRRDGGQQPATVRLYDQSGRLLHSEQWTAGDLHLDLSALAAGVYMLQVDNRTFKITKQ